MLIPKGTPLFFTNKDLEIEKYKYLHTSGNRHVIEDSRGVNKIIPEGEMKYYILSERVALTELESVIRSKIDKVHNRLKEMKQEFNPVDDYDVIRVYYGGEDPKEVHQYDLKTKKFIQTFPSHTQAYKEIGKRHGGAISACTKGIRKSAYGFRWSNKKMPVIK